MKAQADRLDAILAPHGISLDSKEIKVSEVLEVDSKTGKFRGTHADKANEFYKRLYRKEFAVPELT